MKKLVTLVIMVLPLLLMAEVVSEDFSGWSDGSYGTVSTYTDANGGMWESNNALINSSSACGSSALRFNDDSGANEYVLYSGIDGNGKDVGIGTVSFVYRHWDADGSSVSFQVEYNQAGGGWTAIGPVVNVTSTTCMSFSETVELSGDDILFRIRAVTDQERLLIDDILITDFGAPAPIELAAFSATKASHSIQLNWTTLSEVNNELFVIEHSRNGTTFNTIGTLEGAGTTSEIQNYVFNHDSPVKGNNYYRLMQVDYSRAHNFSSVEVVKWGAENALEIFPTLVSDRLTIILDDDNDEKQIFISNLNGQMIENWNTSERGTMEFDLSTMSSGTYFLTVVSNGGSRSAKVIKL